MNGSGASFSLAAIIDALECCLLCDRRTVAMGVFEPKTDEMRAVVMRLVPGAMSRRSKLSVAYGLCRSHATESDYIFTQVELAIRAAARQVQ